MIACDIEIAINLISGYNGRIETISNLVGVCDR